MNVTIRRARPEDLEDVLRLLRQIAALHEEGRPDIFRKNAAKYDAAAFEALLAREDETVFVAECGGVLVGYAFCELQVREDHPLLQDMRTLYVDDLCVDESMRGHGIGTMLLDAAKERAKELRCHNIDLNVWEFNESAKQFYEHYGMRTFRRYMEIVLD